MKRLILTFLFATLTNVAISSAEMTCTTKSLTQSGGSQLYASLRVSDCVDTLANETKVQKEFGLCYTWEVPGSKGFLGLFPTSGANCISVSINDLDEEARAKMILSSFQSPAQYPEFREQINLAAGDLYYGRIEKATSLITSMVKVN